METLKEPLLSPEDVAELVQVVPATVRRWLRLGLLPGVKLPGRSRGTWRIRPADLERFLADRTSAGAAS
ncbi:MAG: helix-turn-helix domain-containing protein [Actinomycetes bacterium]